MATNKNALIRYLALDRCLQNSYKKWDITKLTEACNEALSDIDPKSSGVQKRQIYNDLKFMQDPCGYNAPIEVFKEGRNAYYRYNNRNFSINNQPLNSSEASQLKETLVILSRFQGLPQFEWIEEMKARLEQSFKLKTSSRVISFDENPFLRGKERIGELYQSIVNETVLLIKYQTFSSSDPTEIEIHPYFLKEYNNRWYLLGWNDDLNKLINLALDRISSVKTSNTAFHPNSDFDLEDYFHDVVGITVHEDKNIEEIILKIENELLPYIGTKPLHGSQKEIKTKDGSHLIKLKVIPNYELEAQLLSFGEMIEVIEPDELREKIKSRIKKLHNKYK